MSTMRFDIITIFPQIFKGFTDESLIARAQEKEILKIELHNLRDWTNDNHRTVDDRPFGGGVGMVMKVEPIMKAIEDIKKENLSGQAKSRVILFSPRGKKFDQKSAKHLAKYEQLILICGRYEGVDERVTKYIADETFSIGDYILNGGEVAAMVVIETVGRILPGFIAKNDSALKQDHAQYTRPETVNINSKKRSVPKILLGGNHKKIQEWRKLHEKKL